MEIRAELNGIKIELVLFQYKLIVKKILISRIL